MTPAVFILGLVLGTIVGCKRGHRRGYRDGYAVGCVHGRIEAVTAHIHDLHRFGRELRQEAN